MGGSTEPFKSESAPFRSSTKKTSSVHQAVNGYHSRGRLKAAKGDDWSLPLLLVEVAQLDVSPTGGQEVEGSTPAGSTTFFQGDLIMKYFLQSDFPFP